MPTPVLRLRKDIWAHFPVNVDSMGRGANGADRHCVEWHNGKVRQMAQAAGKPDAQMRAELLPQLLHALSKSTAWTVEAPHPGSKCVAVLAMKFAQNNTRKANVRRWNQTRNARNTSPKPKASRWNQAPNKPRSNKTKSANKPKSANRTVKAAKNHSGLEGEAMYRKARAILNIMSKDTVDRLSHEFASLTPRTVGDAEELFKIVADIALDQQAYHPLVIHLLHVLDSQHKTRPYPEKPSTAVGARMLARAMEEPVFAKMEVAAEEGGSPKNIEEKVNLQRRFFRSVMLFTGFMYREGMIAWTSYKQLLRHLASVAFETDPNELDYRVYDGYVQGLLLTLIRGGARMVAGGDAAATFATLAAGFERLATEAKRGFIRSQSAEFLKSAAEGFTIQAGLPWSIGAPETDIKVRASPKAAAPAAVAAVGLGADIAELWRRFPLDVKQDGAVYVVRFHGKKLRERFDKDAGKYKSITDLEATLAKHILQLIDASAYWKRGPAVAGTLVTVVKK